MTLSKITENITNIKENYQNGNITGDEMCELLDDLVCEAEECQGAFAMGDDDDYYQTFEETDFTKLDL